ncbi:hypothetical protein ACOSQ3_005430 [Xanthoceras sorbifolium]
MICNMRETINGWVSFPQVEIQTIAMRMIAKFEKYWSDILCVIAVAAVLDPRYKILHVDFHFEKLYAIEYESKAFMRSTLIEQVEQSSSFDYSIEVLAGDEGYKLYESQAISI